MVIENGDVEHWDAVWPRLAAALDGVRDSSWDAARTAVARHGLYEPAADGVAGEFDAVAHAELFEDVRAVALDRLLGDEEHLADLLVGVRLGDELDDLLLARGEHVRVERLAGAGALDVLAHERAHAAGIEERLTPHRGPARLDEVAVDGALEHVAGGAGADRLEQVLLAVVHREHEDADVGLAMRDLARRLQSGLARHRDVEDR